MKTKLVALLGWLVLPVALASLVWAIILWRYPVEQPLAPQPIRAKPQVAWPHNLAKFWVSTTQAELEQEATTNASIPLTSLPIQVQGVLFSSQIKRSVVLLSYKNKQLTLSLGDELDTDIFLALIEPDALIFSNQGQLEKLVLHLEHANLNLDASAADSNTANIASSRTPNNSTNNTLETQRLSSRILEDTFGPQFKQQLLSDPLQLMSYITLQPRNQNGKLEGFVLQAGAKPELFQQLGLVAGDLLVAVDGIAVSDTAALMQLTANLAQAEAVAVDIKRGTKLLRLSLEME